MRAFAMLPFIVFVKHFSGSFIRQQIRPKWANKLSISQTSRIHFFHIFCILFVFSETNETI